MAWLLSSRDPSVRFLTRTDVLGQSLRTKTVREDRDAIPRGPRVRALLRGQRRDGGFGGHPYKKWTGAHWRLVSLVELALPPGHPKALAAAEQVLGWLRSPGHLNGVQVIDGLARRCASQEGNALAVCVRLGMAEDTRVGALAASLVEWQWPEGGWNCDVRRGVTHPSFHESLPPLWGLTEFARATGDGDASAAADRAAEFVLRHRVFRSERTGEPMHPEVVKLHYPPYWHYDILQALLVLGRLGRLDDDRAADALQLLLRLRLPDGRWAPSGCWWSPPGSSRLPEVVDWGRSGPNEMITLNALRVLRMAGEQRARRACAAPRGHRDRPPAQAA